MSGLRLSDAIADLRAELTRALNEGTTEALQFDVGPIELELELAVTTEGGVKAETKWWVVSGGADARAERGTTHRLKLVLTPRHNGGDLTIVSDHVVTDGA
jgi:hypothetical protein